MKTKHLLTIIMALIMVVQVQMAMAQKADKSFDGWTLLGTRTVDYTIDRDVVSVEESPEIFKTLKFIVKNGTINMHKGAVHFTDGDKMDIEFADEVNKTNDGRIVELKGNNKVIEKVTFWYDTKNASNSKAIVEVWGKK